MNEVMVEGKYSSPSSTVNSTSSTRNKKSRRLDKGRQDMVTTASIITNQSTRSTDLDKQALLAVQKMEQSLKDRNIFANEVVNEPEEPQGVLSPTLAPGGFDELVQGQEGYYFNEENKEDENDQEIPRDDEDNVEASEGSDENSCYDESDDDDISSEDANKSLYSVLSKVRSVNEDKALASTVKTQSSPFEKLANNQTPVELRSHNKMDNVNDMSVKPIETSIEVTERAGTALRDEKEIPNQLETPASERVNRQLTRDPEEENTSSRRRDPVAVVGSIHNVAAIAVAAAVVAPWLINPEESYRGGGREPSGRAETERSGNISNNDYEYDDPTVIEEVHNEGDLDAYNDNTELDDSTGVLDQSVTNSSYHDESGHSEGIQSLGSVNQGNMDETATTLIDESDHSDTKSLNSMASVQSAQSQTSTQVKAIQDDKDNISEPHQKGVGVVALVGATVLGVGAGMAVTSVLDNDENDTVTHAKDVSNFDPEAAEYEGAELYDHDTLEKAEEGNVMTRDGDTLMEGENDDIEERENKENSESKGISEEEQRQKRCLRLLWLLLCLLCCLLVLAAIVAAIVALKMKDDDKEEELTLSPTAAPTTVEPLSLVGEWVQKYPLLEGPLGSQFGHAVGLDDNYMTAGSPNFEQKGSVFTAVYDDIGEGDWIIKETLFGEDVGDNFGAAIDLVDERLVVGAPNRLINGTLLPSGAAYFFKFNDSENRWNQVGSAIRGEESELAQGGEFGASVSLGIGIVPRVVVGAPKMNFADSPQKGKVYTYEEVSGEWLSTEKQPITGKNANDWFGAALDMSDDGNHFIVGAPGSGGIGGVNGYFQIYEWSGSEWVLSYEEEGMSGEAFGSSVLSLTNEFFAVGGPGYMQNAGRIVIYKRNGLKDYRKIGEIVGKAGDVIGKPFSISGGSHDDGALPESFVGDEILMVVFAKANGGIESYGWDIERDVWVPRVELYETELDDLVVGYSSENGLMWGSGNSDKFAVLEFSPCNPESQDTEAAALCAWGCNPDEEVCAFQQSKPQKRLRRDFR